MWATLNCFWWYPKFVGWKDITTFCLFVMWDVYNTEAVYKVTIVVACQCLQASHQVHYGRSQSIDTIHETLTLWSKSVYWAHKEININLCLFFPRMKTGVKIGDITMTFKSIYQDVLVATGHVHGPSVSSPFHAFHSITLVV